jgi:AcrR family transcriptional regulator
MTTTKESTADASRRSNLVMQAILDHAATLFDERGYAETRLQDIAASVGLSRPTIYYYFNSKEDILIALLWDMISVDKVLEPVSDASLSPYQRLRELMIRIGMQVVEKPARVRIFNRNLSQLPRDVVREFTAVRHRLREALTRALSDAMDAGQVRTIDPELTTSIIFGAITGMPSWYHSPDGTFDREILDAVVDILLSGVAVPAQERHDGTFEDVVGRVRGDLDFLSRSYARAAATPAGKAAPRSASKAKRG